MNQVEQVETYGKLINENGSIYYGQLLNNKQHGLGIMQKRSNNINEKYLGEWRDGLREGFGVEIYSNLSNLEKRMYVGDWIFDKKNGMGRMTFSSGITYDGEWLNDKMHGKGVMESENGKIYEGAWIKNLRTGKGMEYSKYDREVYYVEYKEGKKIERMKL